MTSLFTVSNIYFSIYYIPTSQLLITILLVWEEGGLVGGGTQQYDGVLESMYSPAPNAATSSPFSLIHLGKHDEVSGDTPIIGLGGPNWTSVFTPDSRGREEARARRADWYVQASAQEVALVKPGSLIYGP